MNFKEKINNLGGIDFIQKSYSEILPSMISLPENVKEFILKYGFGIFNQNIVFNSIGKIQGAYEDNTVPFTIFYGLGEGVNSLSSVHEDLSDQIPKNYFVFAEANPGDQLCLNLNDNKIYLWLHDNGNFYLVAKSFEDFIDRLTTSNHIVSDDDLEEEWFDDDF